MANSLKNFLNRNLSSEIFSSADVFRLVLPVVVDQSFIIGLSIFNTAMISSAGIAAVSAVNMVESVNIFLINIFIALATGGTVLVAQARGKKAEKLVGRSTRGTIVTVFSLALFLSFLMVLFHGVILKGLFGESSRAVMKNAQIYFIGSVASYPGLALVEAVCGVFRGVADTKTSLFLSFFTNLVYVLLNLLFIMIFHWGIMGMGAALIIARISGGILSLVVLSRNTELQFAFHKLWPFDYAMSKRVLVIGFPFAIEQLFFNGGKIIVQIFIVQLGTLALTANAVANSLTMLMEIIPASLSLALVPIVGQSIGAGAVKNVQKYWRSFLLLASGSTVITGGLLILGYSAIIFLFNVPLSVEHQVYQIIVVVFFARIIAWPVSFITPSALRAAGDANYTSIVSLGTMWCVRIVLGYLLGIHFQLGLIGIWGAMCLEWGIRGIIFSLRIFSNKWQEKRLV